MKIINSIRFLYNEYPRQYWLMIAGIVLATAGGSMIWPFLLIYAGNKLIWLSNLLGGLLFVVANVAFGAAMVFYNAFLPEIASPERRDAVSSRGWAAGYLGGGLLLAAHLDAAFDGGLLAIDEDGDPHVVGRAAHCRTLEGADEFRRRFAGAALRQP